MGKRSGGLEEFEDERLGRDDGQVAEIHVREVDGVREVVIVPRGIEALGEEGHHEVAALQQCVATVMEAREAMAGHVQVLRDLGVSWESIGWCVGTTGRAASMRWGE